MWTEEIVIAIDPGKISGVVIWNPAAVYEEGNAPLTAFEADLDELKSTIFYEMLGPDTPRVVCERYDMMPRQGAMSAQQDAQHIIGGLEWITLEHGGQFDLVSRAVTKKLTTDGMLRALGLHVRTPDGHLDDAWRVFFCHIWVKDPETFTQIIESARTK
jgi:hypothetical protein